ncbi:MAG: Uncharacterized protein LiPW16_288 [Microgenomates group bacterium LiPW_16]|nr:MAG: Uncharacterized protein LiPW16_288 [Microgenomates group bacterium LiPW_16]
MEEKPPETQTETKEELVRPLVTEKKIILPKFMPILGVVLLVLAGIATGFFLSQRQVSIKTQKMVGSTDVKTFRDVAEGVLEKGGIDGEGTHKLLRPGLGEGQTAYLNSSVINLDDYVGKKVRVWGETFAAQKAGWLMDVGRVEVLE